jgi:1,4-dihydroxy-2-naphthoyl-CoA synthase
MSEHVCFSEAHENTDRLPHFQQVLPVTKSDNQGNTLVTESSQHSSQSKRISKAQINANQRNISGLRQLSRTNLIVSYKADIRKNSTVSY